MLLLLGVGVMVASGGHRGRALWSGVLALPFAYLEQFAVPVYWDPPRIQAWGNAGPEDFLFVFAIGGLAWVVAALPSRHPGGPLPPPRAILRRYAAVVLTGFPLSLLALVPDVKPMTYTLLPIVVSGAVFLTMRPAWWRLALGGAAGYCLAHCAVFKGVLVVAPSFIGAWNRDNLWGPAVWGLPLDEIVWALGFGAVWPLFAGLLFDHAPLWCRRGRAA